MWRRALAVYDRQIIQHLRLRRVKPAREYFFIGCHTIAKSDLMNTQMLSLRIICTAAALVALCSCTRTSDGTVVPKYQMTVSQHGWSPRIAILKRTTEPPPGQFLEPAPLPEVKTARARLPSRTTRRQSAPLSHSEKPDVSRQTHPEILHCRQVPANDGRYRVVCS